MFLLLPFPLYHILSLGWEFRHLPSSKELDVSNTLAEKQGFCCCCCCKWIKQIEIKVLPKSPDSISVDSWQVWLQGMLLNQSLICQFINSWFEEDTGICIYLFSFNFLTKRELWPRELLRRCLLSGTSSRKDRETVTYGCFTFSCLRCKKILLYFYNWSNYSTQ